MDDSFSEERQLLGDELADARALVERGEAKAALKLLERVRQESLAGEHLAEVQEVAAVAALIHRQTTGKRQTEAGGLAFNAQQNIRVLEQRQALADGREWVDPFPPVGRSLAASKPGRFDFLGRFVDLNEDHPPSLARSLVLSFLFCALLALAAEVAGDTPVGAWLIWIAACAAYWLVFAVLQVRWRRRGYRGFWRPVYPTALLVFICASLIGVPLLLVPRFRRWLWMNMQPGARA